MIKTILFDLDGTLLPMDQDQFTKAYFSLLAKKLAPHGYDPQLLVKNIWAGTMAMVANDGQMTNEAVFWDKFKALYGESVMEDYPLFDAFYQEDFGQVQASCGFTEEAAKLVAFIKSQGLKVALATNPIFPSVATMQRIEWAGLNAQDFELITTYENSSTCKPNPQYYQEVLEKLNCQPNEVLMIGNDVEEDYVAQTLGINTFLIDDCLINRNDKDLSLIDHGSFKDCKNWLKNKIKLICTP